MKETSSHNEADAEVPLPSEQVAQDGDTFQEGPTRSVPVSNDASDGEGGETLVLDIDGYEGPLDVLLALGRNQKVDLTRISILALAEQYLNSSPLRAMELELRRILVRRLGCQLK